MGVDEFSTFPDGDTVGTHHFLVSCFIQVGHGFCDINVSPALLSSFAIEASEQLVVMRIVVTHLRQCGIDDVSRVDSIDDEFIESHRSWFETYFEFLVCIVSKNNPLRIVSEARDDQARRLFLCFESEMSVGVCDRRLVSIHRRDADLWKSMIVVGVAHHSTDREAQLLGLHASRKYEKPHQQCG